MRQPTGIDHFKAAIIEILDETFDTHHGLYLDRGTSLFETLATVTAAEASIPVSASCASIAAQVNHVTYYLDVLNGDLSGNEPASVDWTQAWTIGPVNDEEWTTLIGHLRACRQRDDGAARIDAGMERGCRVRGCLDRGAHSLPSGRNPPGPLHHPEPDDLG